MLKRGYHGTFHRMRSKHVHLYVGEFTGRHITLTKVSHDDYPQSVRIRDE